MLSVRQLLLLLLLLMLLLMLLLLWRSKCTSLNVVVVLKSDVERRVSDI